MKRRAVFSALAATLLLGLPSQSQAFFGFFGGGFSFGFGGGFGSYWGGPGWWGPGYGYGPGWYGHGPGWYGYGWHHPWSWYHPHGLGYGYHPYAPLMIPYALPVPAPAVTAPARAQEK